MVNVAEAGGLDVSAEVEGGDVGESEGSIGARCPAAILVEVGDAELVDPNDAVLDGGGVVADANHEYADVTEGRVAEHGDGVALVVGVAPGVWDAEAHTALLHALGSVTLQFEVDEPLQVEVEVVVEGPNALAVGGAVGVVSGGGEGKRYLVFVVVVLDVGAESDEQAELARAEVGDVVDKVLGVYPHLEALVVAEVLLGVAIYGASIAGL